MSRRKKKPSLQNLIRQGLTKEDHPLLTQELVEGTDRSSALIGCAMVDNTLVMALRSRFVAMDEKEFDSIFYSPTAPLSSLSARVKIGRSIGIYGPKVAAMIDTIRRVRNVFAHSLRPVRFSEPLIKKECLTLPDAKLTKVRRELKLPEDFDPLRERYVAVCGSLGIIFEDHAKRHFGKPITIDIPDG